MGKQVSLKKNFIMNAILTMSAFIFPLITFPYVSRILLPIGTGKVAFATSVVTYFAMFAQLGIPTYGIRACAKVRDNKTELSKTVQEIFIINILMSCISYAALVVALFCVPRFQEEKLLFLIIGTTLVFNAIGMEWLYKGLEQYTYITIRSLLFKAVALVAMFLLIKEQGDYILYGGITILAGVGSNVLNFINVHKHVSMKPVGHYDLRKHMKAVLTFFGMSVATTIYTHLDVAMLGFIQDDEQVGYYNAAVRIKVILVSIVTSLGTVLLPRVSYYIQKGRQEEFLKLTRKAIHFVFVAAVPVVVYFVLFAKEGILFFAGPTYESAVVSMQIIMPTVLLIGLTNVMGIQILVPMGKEKVVLYSEIVGAIVDVILNVIFIPAYGAAGAALGTLMAEIVVLICQFAYLKNLIADAYRQVRYLPIILGGVVGVLLSGPVKQLVIPNVLILILSGMIFMGSYLAVLYLLREPLLRELLGQFRMKLKKKLWKDGER